VAQQSYTPAREECNKYDLTVVTWSIMMIGPAGLLLVVSHLFANPV